MQNSIPSVWDNAFYDHVSYKCSFSVSPLFMSEPSDKLDMLSDHSPLSSGMDSGQQSPVSPENRKTHRGIRKLWGKYVFVKLPHIPLCSPKLNNPSVSRIRRSQSGSPVQIHDQEGGDFKRGGFRATAGPRLAHSGKTRFASSCLEGISVSFCGCKASP